MSTQDRHDSPDLLGSESYAEGASVPAPESMAGMEVRDVDGDKIGKVDDVYTDTGGDHVRYLAVTTGWFGTKRHMIPVDDVRHESADGEGYLVVPYDKDTLKAGPTHDQDDDVTHRHEEEVYGHYGRTAYWDAVRARQTAPAPTPEIAEAEVADAIRRGEDPNGIAVKRWGA